MDEDGLGYVLDSPTPPRAPADWPLKRWAVVARDRVGDVGAVMQLQRSNAHGFYSSTDVYGRGPRGWTSDFGNGDLWPVPPDEPRPSGGRPFAMMTGTSGSSTQGGSVWTAFTAGVVTTEVTRLHVRSAVEEHDIEIEERIGAFVALTIHGPEEVTFRLTAYDAAGREIDRVDYRDPWSSDE